jgi:hypothetical protein
VVCVFFIFQQITGINVPLYYGPKLLGPLFQAGSSKVASTMAGVEVTTIIAAVNVIAMICFAVTCLLAIAFINRFLPETKNHSVEEVVEIFEREAEGGHDASGPLERGAAAA